MKSVVELARREVKDFAPCVHGGNFSDLIDGLQVGYSGFLDFSVNVNPLGSPPRVAEAVERGFRRIPFYPDSSSTLLRECVSGYVGGVSSGNVVVGNGSVELVHLFAQVFVDRGDEAVVVAPTFGEYECAVRKAGGRVCYTVFDRDFSLDPVRVLEKVGPRTKVIFLCNPNNPTGVFSAREKITHVVEEASNRDVLVFLDEGFIEFVGLDRGFSLAGDVEAYGNIFVLRSFTKVFGLTGLRVGYGVSCREIIDLLLRVKVPWNVNCLAQEAAVEALKDKGFLEKTLELIRVERSFLADRLRQIKGFRPFPSYANFILVDIRDSGFTATELSRDLLRRGILVRDCSSFKGLDEYYVRVAVRTRGENEKLLEALMTVVGAC